MQGFAKPTDADVRHDLLLDKIETQLGYRPLAHADQSDGRTKGDLRDPLANVSGKDAFGAYLEPRIPGDANDALIVEAMDDLAHPLHRAIDQAGNTAIGHSAGREQNDPG